MGRILLLWVLIGCLLSMNMVTAARGGGRGKGTSSRKGFGSKPYILIRHRNPASASYYEHKDVSI